MPLILEDKIVRLCEQLGLHPKNDPLGDGHHTEEPFAEEDKATGNALAFFLGTLFSDVFDDISQYWDHQRTSVDEWSRVARALRIHGLAIRDLENKITAPPVATGLFDTSIAGRWADEVHALILTEHWGHAIEPGCLWRCPFGDNDDGRAFGILQQHPPFIQEFYRTAGGAALAAFLARDDDTWPVAQIKAAATFLTMYDSMAIELLVQSYNQGVKAVQHGVRAPVYLDRFTQSLAKIRQAKSDRA